MPPEDDGKPLTKEEKEILTRWVKQGGEYASHWAFVPPIKRESAPETKVIDFYIEKNLQTQKPPVIFAEESSRDILARRAALTPTGLPP